MNQGSIYVVRDGDDIYCFSDLDLADRFTYTRLGRMVELIEEPILGEDFVKEEEERLKTEEEQDS